MDAENPTSVDDGWKHLQMITENFLPYDEKEAKILKMFEILGKIDKGGYGTVYKVSHRKTGTLYALKVMNKVKAANTIKRLQRVLEELQVHRMLEHPLITELCATCSSSRRLYLVMEYASGGDLSNLLNSIGALEPAAARFYIAEISVGIKYLHEMNIAHRDIKPENVLLTETGHIKICDFGLSKVNMYKDTYSDECVGTTLCMAPEVIGMTLDGEKIVPHYTRLADIWSLGIVLYRLLFGCHLFCAETTPECNEDILDFNDTDRNIFPPGFEDVSGDLILKTLEREPSRPDIYLVQAHPFFAGVRWDQVECLELEPPFVRPFLSKKSKRPCTSFAVCGSPDSDDEGVFQNYFYNNPNFRLLSDPKPMDI